MRAGRTLQRGITVLLVLAFAACGSSDGAKNPIPILVTPDWGWTTGGTEVVLQVAEADTVGAILFNDQEATNVEFVLNQTITCTTPIGLAGLADVTVVGYPNRNTLPEAFLYLPEGTWARADGGPQDDVAHDVAFLADGTILQVGTFEGTAVFGDGEVHETTLVSAGGRDAYLARFSARGALLYALPIASSPGNDGAYGLVALPDRSCLVVGEFTGEVVFGEGEPNETTLTSAGGQDGFLAHYDRSGDLIWVRAVGGVLDDRLLDVEMAGTDGYAVVGSFRTTITVGSTELESAGLDDALIAVYDTAGAVQWAAGGGGLDADAYTRVIAWADGALLALGAFRDKAVFGPYVFTSLGARDAVLVRYRASGSLDWAEAVQGPGDTLVVGASLYESGDVAVTGSFEGDALLAAGRLDEVRLESDGGDQDLFLARYDDQGNVFWARRAGGWQEGATAGGVALLTDANDSCLLLGAFAGTVRFGPDELFEQTLISAGQQDLVFARYRPNGALEWAFRDGGTGDEVPSAFDRVVDGTLLVTGAFSGTAALDPSGAGAVVIPSLGERDPFLGRYDVSD